MRPPRAHSPFSYSVLGAVAAVLVIGALPPPARAQSLELLPQSEGEWLPDVVSPGVPQGRVPPAVQPVPLPAEQEDLLLQDLFRYLQLSRIQVARVLPVACIADRRRAAFDGEQQRLFGDLDALATTKPDEAQRRAQLKAQRADEFAASIGAMVTGQFTRLLTREQIALIWRLTQGTPPKYAEADAALLDANAGFVTAPRFDVFLGGGRGAILRLRERAPDGAAQGDALLELERAEAEVRDVGAAQSTVRVQESALRSRNYTQLGWPNPAGDGRPFPQLVAETNNIADVTFAVDPLVRRVFTSPRFVPMLASAYTHGVQAREVRPAGGVGQRIRDYRLEQGVRDLSGRGPDLEPLGGALQHGQYVFDAGQGVRIPELGVTDQYAVEMSCRYYGGPHDQGGGDNYQKIVDFKSGTDDGGLYFYNGHLTFYTLANGGVPVPGQEHRIRLERNRSTRIVKAYLDWKPIFAFVDLDDAAVFDKGSGLFFVDDQLTKHEQGPGTLRWLMVWSSPAGR